LADLDKTAARRPEGQGGGSAASRQVVSVARLRIDPVWDPIRNDPEFQKLPRAGNGL
jgi:hypothetical protein